MRKVLLACVLALFSIGGLAAQISVSGLLDASLSLRAGAGDAPDFSYGIENYGSLRMTARLREMATVFADLNFIALSGDSAAEAALMAEMTAAGGGAFAATPFVSGQNYIAGFELERLYFRINTENARLDGGLMRIPIGHGFVWRPTDFLNPANPLLTNARPRPVLGAELSWWPAFDFKVSGFGVAPMDPLSQSGRGALSGMTLEREWDRVVAQLLYAFESPRDGVKLGLHRSGLSIYADLELGFALDALYTYNHEQETGLEGLSLSFGFDYTLFRGKLLVIAEYLYSGSASSTSIGGGGYFANEHYLYTGFTWLFSEFTNAGIALISGFDDISFTPIVTFSHALFQGATLNLTAQIPLDRHLLAGGKRGELGPLPPDGLFPPGIAPFGRYFEFTAMLKLRF